MHIRFMLTGIALALLCSCSGSSNGSPGPDTGGNGPVGGAANSGGIASTGGAPSNGGNATTGGNASTGGKSNAGGVPSTGGITSTGGIANTGGAPLTGGQSGTGGNASTGGTTSAGGATATGGKSNTGGVVATGGKSSTGGANSTGGSSGTSTSGCTRDMLQSAVDSYMTAIQAGSYSTLPSSVKYSENGATVALGSGLWATPLQVNLLPPLTLLDVDKCQTYSEVIVNNNHKYVFGARLTVTASSGQISAISVIVTDCDDWGFNADTYLQYSKAEQQAGGWAQVAPANQLTRQQLLDAGAAYFAYWSDPTVNVPWGYPCSRLEGGAETNPTGNPSITCSVGITTQQYAIPVNDQLVDVDYGMVVDFINLPGPDSHWFRVNANGVNDAGVNQPAIRYIHTLTDCYVNGTWQCPGSAPVCS